MVAAIAYTAVRMPSAVAIRRASASRRPGPGLASSTSSARPTAAPMPDAVGPGRGRWRDRRRQTRVPTQDRLVQRAQLRARVQAELVAQPAAELLVGGQGLALAARAVERAQVCRAQTLSPRVRGHEVGQLACDEGALAERQPRLGEVLQRRQPLLLEPRDGRTHERLVGEVGVRAAAPQRQRLGEQGDDSWGNRSHRTRLVRRLGREPGLAARHARTQRTRPGQAARA